MTHFYSDKKNTAEMIKMMDLLRAQYRHCSTILPLMGCSPSSHVSTICAVHLQTEK